MIGFYLLIATICIGLFISVFDPVMLVVTFVMCILIVTNDNLFKNKKF